jgi:phosphatidylglycerophosphate synthase
MQRSKNFDDIPALGGMIFVTGCLMLNIFTVFLLLEGLGINTGIEFKKEYKYVFTLSLVASLLFYYSYKGRYKKIVESYEQKKKGKQLHPVIVIIIYLASSFLLGMLAAMYKNHDWIFG